jgi:putative FmdB family regulatory protein
MPTYEYKCPKGHLFEKTFPRITSQRHAKCPVCGKRAERLISGGAGVHFKGSGFYATDYKRPAGTTEKADHTAEKAEKAEKVEKVEKVEKPAESKPKPKKDSSSDK